MTIRNSRRAKAAMPLMILGAATLFGACSVDKVLQVPDPDVSKPSDLTGVQALPTLLASAIGDFQVAFSGTGGNTGLEGLTNLTGLFTDEFFFSETFPTRIQVEKRAIDRTNQNMRDLFFTVERARASALRAETTYAKLAPTDTGYSESLSLEGYSFLFLAEAYCSGVPVSGFNANGQVVNGAPLTTQQLLDSAIARFQLAFDVAAKDTDAKATRTNLSYLARIGNARALMFQGNQNLGAAAALAAGIPTTFQYLVFSSSNTDRQNNGIWELNWNEGRWTQADSEANVGLPFRTGGDLQGGAGDPRTPFLPAGKGFDRKTLLFVTLKYPDRDAPTVLASGVEAQLIVAENQLANNDVAGMLTTLNALRANSGLTFAQTLTDPGTPDGRLRLLFHERGFWLYLTNHRLGDMRRLVRSTANGGYGLGVNTVFPNGTYQGVARGVYGDDVNFPIPIEEDNNPLSHGCIDRNP